jgi:hypothetical protein
MAPDYAITVDETFAEWRVFADNEPSRRIMASTKPT